MAYLDITNYTLGQLVSVTDFNQILANMRALYAPPNNHYEVDESGDYTTTSTSFVAIDVGTGAGTKLYRQITLDAAGDVLVFFTGSFTTQSSGGQTYVYLDVAVDGVRIGTNDGIIAAGVGNGTTLPNIPISFIRLVPGLAAGVHTFQLQWKAYTTLGSLSVKMFAGAGTSNADLHPQFSVVKV